MAAIAADAAVTLPNYITDNMIVQQNSMLTITGHAFPGSNVKVSAGWTDDIKSVKVGKDGVFTVMLPTPPAGGPYSISFQDKEGRVDVENVVSGDIWFCSGQSNMEFPVQGWTTVMGYDREVATAHNPDIRLLQVRKKTAIEPQDDIEVNGGGWQICSSASMADFSAIAYFFARELHEELGIPIGVIDSTWGGTPAEAWTSAYALGGVAGFEGELADIKAAEGDLSKLNALYDKRVDEWVKKANASDFSFDKGSLQAGAEWKGIQVPGYWEQSALPGFDGIVWLQREIEVPAQLAGKPMTIRFSAIDDEDETYFNGTLVGKGSGYATPRSYDIAAELVEEGKNVITVRVSDFGGEGGFAPGYMEAVVEGKTLPLDGEWRYRVQTDFSKMDPKPVSPQSSSYPSVLYNAMMHPLKDMPVKGVLWYQGCANVGRDGQYAPLFKALINDWRSQWGEKLPFYFVQLAGYLQPRAVQPDSEWAALRNAQAKALELDNTAMAVAIDLGNPADIHPKNKQDVAHRLALIALNRDYGKDCEYEAPSCISVARSGKALTLKFDRPVKPSSNALTGFIIAGKDGVFTTATPIMEDETTITVSSPLVPIPEFVRYNWADYPCGNLYGKTGLPVAPFSNDK